MSNKLKVILLCFGILVLTFITVLGFKDYKSKFLTASTAQEIIDQYGRQFYDECSQIVANTGDERGICYAVKKPSDSYYTIQLAKNNDFKVGSINVLVVNLKAVYQNVKRFPLRSVYYDKSRLCFELSPQSGAASFYSYSNNDIFFSAPDTNTHLGCSQTPLNLEDSDPSLAGFVVFVPRNNDDYLFRILSMPASIALVGSPLNIENGILRQESNFPFVYSFNTTAN